MSRFSNWVGRKFKRKQLQNGQSNQGLRDISEEMPFLPAERPLILTPTASQENLLLKSTASMSPFFAGLPIEIRREIYSQAFGKKTIHMALQHKYYERSAYMTKMYPGSHPRRIDQHRPLTSEGWYWWNCVCHFTRDFYFNDDCRHMEERYWTELEKRRGLPSGSFSIGLMGWLLTCRQAYSATIDFFYRNNTFHVNGTTLPRWLPTLLLPQRLNAITSVELVWDLSLPLGDLTPFRHDLWREFVSSVGHIPRTFPSLQRISLSIGTNADIGLPDAALEDYEARLYPPLDSMVETYGSKLQDCTIAISWGVQAGLMSRAVAAGLASRSATWWRFWRVVRGETKATRALGHWLTRGVEDGPLQPSYCFR